MNIQEFKAWFEGFNENLNGPPDTRQWARIVEKICMIKNAPPTKEVVFRDHWYQPWQRYWPSYVTWAVSQDKVRSDSDMVSAQVCATSSVFNPSDAFRDLGRAEAASIRPKS